MNNAVFEKTIENIRKHRDIKLVAKERKRNYGMIMKLLYDYVKPKYGEKAKLCYVDRDTFMVYIKTDDIYKDIAESKVWYFRLSVR